MKIEIEKSIHKAEYEKKGIRNWPVWEKEVSTFSWYYESSEIFYVIEGKARIKTIYEEVLIEKGDLVICPAGLRSTWIIEEKFKKNYNFL